MKNKTSIRKAYAQRARVKVILAANPDNFIIQVVGTFMFNLWSFAIKKYETKNGSFL